MRRPSPLRTNFEYLWWINFALKWQGVFAYTLMFTAQRNAKDNARVHRHELYVLLQHG